MNKVTDTYYVKYEWNPRHAAMEVFQEVFGVDFMMKELHSRDDILFWVGNKEIIVTQVSSVSTGLFRVEILDEDT